MINITRRFHDAVLKVAGGSGGGSVENPSVTVKIVNDNIASDIFYAFYVFTDNRIELHFESVSTDQDKTSTFMAMYDVEEETYIVNLGLLMPDNEYNERSATVTDLVNAEYWGDVIVAITDPTESASFTVIVSPEN